MATATRHTSNRRIGAGVAAPTGQLYTAPEVAAMTPQDRAAYLDSLQPEHRQAMEAALPNARTQMNHNYMVRAIRKVATCPPTAGGITNSFSAGQVLTWNFPIATGAFAKELEFTCTLTVNCATGTSATYAVNAGAPWTLFDSIVILYNGVQARLRPLLLKYLPSIKGFQRPLGGTQQVIAGQSVTTIQNQLLTTIPVATGNNTWTFKFRLPLNALHDLAPAGMLPIQGSNTQAQIQLICASAPYGPDPILNAITTGGTGTGQAVTVTGTIAAECIYTDGQNLQSLEPVTLDLISQPPVPTSQYVIDTTLQPLSAGSLQYQKIQALLEHFYVICCVVDGNQSNKFSAVSNVQAIQLCEDPVGQNKFWAYGTGTNQSMYDYFELIRKLIGQDLDEGIFLLGAGPTTNQQNSSDQDGAATINMLPGGWVAATHAWQVGTTGGVANITPRVETWLVSRNPQGLTLA